MTRTHVHSHILPLSLPHYFFLFFFFFFFTLSLAASRSRPFKAYLLFPRFVRRCLHRRRQHRRRLLRRCRDITRARKTSSLLPSFSREFSSTTFPLEAAGTRPLVRIPRPLSLLLFLRLIRRNDLTSRTRRRRAAASSCARLRLGTCPNEYYKHFFFPCVIR